MIHAIVSREHPAGSVGSTTSTRNDYHRLHTVVILLQQGGYLKAELSSNRSELQVSFCDLSGRALELNYILRASFATWRML